MLDRLCVGKYAFTFLESIVIACLANCTDSRGAVDDTGIDGEESSLVWFSITDQRGNFVVANERIGEDLGYWEPIVIEMSRKTRSSGVLHTLIVLLTWRKEKFAPNDSQVKPYC